MLYFLSLPRICLQTRFIARHELVNLEYTVMSLNLVTVRADFECAQRHLPVLFQIQTSKSFQASHCFACCNEEVALSKACFNKQVWNVILVKLLVDFRVSQTLNMKDGVWVILKCMLRRQGRLSPWGKPSFLSKIYRMRISHKANGPTSRAERPSAFASCPLVGSFINSNLRSSKCIW